MINDDGFMEIDWEDLAVRASVIFKPATPINENELFAGRIEKLRKIVDVSTQTGQHAILYGERGVGKTSIANIISSRLTPVSPDINIISPRINCDSTDNYSSVWKKIFDQIEIIKTKKKIGFTNEVEEKIIKISEGLEGEITPDIVRNLLTFITEDNVVILIIDEFDRITDVPSKTAMADTIKTLSDYAIPATIILVGVADSVDELIEQHYSIERNLVQIHIPRMSEEELHEILTKGLSRLDMTIDDAAKEHISSLSKGLPHYTHLLGLHATRHALDSHRKNIIFLDVHTSIEKAVEEAQQSIDSAYHKAVMSVRKGTIYKQVLLACALAKTDSMGYFAAANVKEPMSNIMSKNYEITGFARHLNDFCTPQRNEILKKIGIKHRYKFRFRNPLMQPYVIMKGLSAGLINQNK